MRSCQTDFFPEWQTDLPSLSEPAQLALNHMRQNFIYRLEWGKLSENLVKMGVLSPLLDLAGFYQSRLQVQDEPNCLTRLH